MVLANPIIPQYFPICCLLFALRERLNTLGICDHMINTEVALPTQCHNSFTIVEKGLTLLAHTFCQISFTIVEKGLTLAAYFLIDKVIVNVGLRRWSLPSRAKELITSALAFNGLVAPFFILFNAGLPRWILSPR